MEWEPVFILGVMGGTLLVSTVRSVLDTGRRDRPVAPRRAAPADGEQAREIGGLQARVAMLEWIAAPAARAAAERKTKLRRGAA
jgi:hypothetical protein